MKIKKFKFKQVVSTNKTAIRIIKKTRLFNGMIISDLQKSGKGQYGKKWISYKGNLFLSFFFKINKIIIPINKITKINCLLVKKLISNYYKKDIIFKSPNDLLIKKKKICGILQEIFINDDKKYLIVGIGLNVIKSPKIRNYPTTNLFELTNKRINIDHLASKLKLIFEKNFSKYYKIII
jgi:BirA family transcriptional regulator, biotin operon repressor / biotin---[acetyl-CoA-carboxylase] ligase